MEDTTAAATSPNAEAGHHGGPDVPAAPLTPQIINGIKVYPTSYVPTKSVLHLPKKMLVKMELEHIEVIHILCFVGITIFLLIGMWKRPNLR